LGAGKPGQDTYAGQLQSFGLSSGPNYAFSNPGPASYSSRRPVTTTFSPTAGAIDPYSYGGVYRSGPFLNDIRNQYQINGSLNPDYVPLDGSVPFLYGARNRRTFRNPPRGAGRNLPPGAYGSWSPPPPGYSAPNPFVMGNYPDYYAPDFDFYQNTSRSDYRGDPYIGPSGGRLNWDQGIQNFLDEFGLTNYTYQNEFNPLLNVGFNLADNPNSLNEYDQNILETYTPDTDLAGLYGDYEKLDEGSFYDIFPTYFDDTLDGTENQLGVDRVGADLDWLEMKNYEFNTDNVNYRTDNQSSSDRYDYDNPMTVGHFPGWFTRPAGLSTSSGYSSDPGIFTNPNDMVNLAYENPREFGLSYGAGESILSSIQGAQGTSFVPGSNALYGGDTSNIESDYAYKMIEEWRRQALGNVSEEEFRSLMNSNPNLLTPDVLSGSSGITGFTGQERGDYLNPYATSMWAQIRGRPGAGSGPTNSGPDINVQDYGGNPYSFGDYSWKTGEDGIYRPWAYTRYDNSWTSDEEYADNPKLITFDTAINSYDPALDTWAQDYQDFTEQNPDFQDTHYEGPEAPPYPENIYLDENFIDPDLGGSGGPINQTTLADFLRDHQEETHRQIYELGKFPDTYASDFTLSTTSGRTGEFTLSGWHQENNLSRTVHPLAGRDISSLNDSEQLELEKIIGSQGDYSNWQNKFKQNMNESEASEWRKNILHIASGGAGYSYEDPMSGLDPKVFSLSGLSELSEEIGLNEFIKLKPNNSATGFVNVGGMATGLESAGITGSRIAGKVDSSINPSIGRLSDYEQFMSDYTTDDRSQPILAPADYGVVSGSQISLPPDMLSSAEYLLGPNRSTAPGDYSNSNIFNEIAGSKDGERYSSYIRDIASGNAFGMGESNNPFTQGFGWQDIEAASLTDPSSGNSPLFNSLMTTWSGNQSDIPGISDPSINENILSSLISGSDVSVWPQAPGSTYGLPEWFSQVPLASEWAPYEPGIPKGYTDYGDGFALNTNSSRTNFNAGGFVENTPEYASAEPSSDLIDMTVSALMGEISNPNKVVEKFVEKYGPDSLSELVEDVVSGGDGSFLRGPGDGQADDVPGLIDGVDPVFLSSGEYVVPADVVKDLGDGSSEGGAQELMKMVDEIRSNNNGRI
jgi:hypothetical protein